MARLFQGIARATLISLFFFFFQAQAQASALSCESIFRASSAELSKPHITPQILHSPGEFEALLHELKLADPRFTDLYSSYNEVAKKITIESHTREVFERFLIEKNLNKIAPEVLKIIPLTIALHDIGKPMAIAIQQREIQHQFTAPMVESFLQKNQWPALDIKRVLAIITYAGFGQLLKGEKSSFEVALEIQRLSVNLQMSPREFYVIKRAFYIADAGSYSQLRPHLFNPTPRGFLTPKGSQLEELEYWLSEPP